MKFLSTLADAVDRGDELLLTEITSGPLIVARNNFVERPWGGTRIRDYKRLYPLPDQATVSGRGIGEAFELAAFDDDDEAARFPSRMTLRDGSVLTLPALLAAHGRRILGDAFVDRYGACLPLLPKTLDIKELLSVQGHPAGHTEVYIIIDADPGATIALGFRADVDPAALRSTLSGGLERQAEFTGLLNDGVNLNALQNLAAGWFASREQGFEADPALFLPHLAATSDPAAAVRLLRQLKQCYWAVLDSLNLIEVRPGQVIYNATPARLLAPGQSPTAEVHALGNPAGREVVALEVRLPGPTYRAWDNVRFPQRPVDVAAALAALNLKATRPEEFFCEEMPVHGRSGVSCSVDCEFFRVEHWRPAGELRCTIQGDVPACLHVIDGSVEFRGPDDQIVARLERGEAALVPVGLSGSTLASIEGAHVVSVTLPCT